LAGVSEALGDTDTAARVCAQCIDLASELDDGPLLNTTRVVLARVARAHGDVAEADVLSKAVLDAPEARNRDLLMVATNERGFVLAVSGHRDAGLALHREALRLSNPRADVRFVASAVEGVAGYVSDIDVARSAMLLGAAEAVRGAPAPGIGADRAFVDETSARARAAPGAARYNSAVAAGRRVSVDEAIALALGDG
jgi:hypothetical protein